MLDADAPFEAWFDGQNVDELKRILTAHRASRVGARAVLLERLRGVLSDCDSVRAVIASLSAPSRTAWDALVNHGCAMPVDAFDAAFAPKAATKDTSASSARLDPVEELQRAGLVVLGAWRGVPSVVVPPIVRSSM